MDEPVDDGTIEDQKAAGDLDGIFERLKGQCIEDLSKTAAWRRMAREDYAFEAGDQWTEDDKSKLIGELRPIITMNRISPIIDSVAGSEVSNRQEVKYIPRSEGDVQVNEVLTSAAKWFRDECDAEDEESDSFRDALICGMGWTETRLDYEEDPDGKPLIDRVDPLEMVWDSSARKKNLADKRRVFHIRRDIPIEEARALCPNDDFEDADYNATWVNTELDDKEKHENDGKYYDKEDVTDADDTKSEKRVTLVRAQWYEREPIFRVMNPQDPSQIVSLTKDQHTALQASAKAAGVPPLKSVKTTRKVYKQAYLGRVLLEIGEAPCKEHFSFFCITGKRDRNKNCFYGLVRKGGIVAERGVFDNDADAEESWAKQDAITWLKKGALADGKWQAKPQANFPVGFYQLTEMAITSIRDVSGVNVETLGMREATQAASLEAQRKQSSMVILQPLFDSLRRYRKNQGRMLLFLIQNYLSDGRLIKIVGEEGAKYVPLVHNEGVATYDVVVDESPTSPDQKEAVWNMLQQILPAIAKIVPPQVYLALLKYSPLPTSAQDDIKKAITDASAGQEDKPDPEVVKAENDIKIEAMKAEAETKRLQMKTDAEIAAMQRKADAQIEINQRAAQADIFAKMTEPKQQTVGEDGQPVQQQQQDSGAAVLGPLLIELTQALKAMSGPKQIVYGPNGEPVGVKPMVN